MEIQLTLARKTVYAGDFVKVFFTLEDGVTADDLEFFVDPNEAAVVSYARGDDWRPERPYVTLLARHLSGKHHLIAVHKPTGDKIGVTTFRVTTAWARNRRRGPGFWFSSSQEIDQPFAAFGSAWGGGPNGPQNTRATPITGTWRVGIVFADTSTRRYPTTAAGRDPIRDLWLDHVARGTVDNGMTRSVRQFYEEVSYGNLTVSAQSLGFVRLPNAWTSYFDAGNSGPQGTLIDAAIAGVDPTTNLNDFDTLLIVTPRAPATATTPERAAWPYASIGKHGPYATADGSVPLAWISCVADWGQGAGDTREIFETISHELGHNLGLWDQYTPGVPNRNVGAWDLMDWDGTHPHLTLAQRMMLGWVRPDWVETFDFGSAPVPVDRTVRLQAIETGAPAPGTKSGVEVRIADGVNYYWEFRNDQTAQIGDRVLPLEPAVLGTDVMGDPGSAPISRPQLLLLNDHADDDGAALTTGGKYKDTDYTTPGFPQQFQVDVTAMAGNTADLRVRYGLNGRPDPSIRPWPASSQRPWQSPDLEVRNARSATRADWANTPWAGHENTVVAKVRNAGTVAAPGVVVNFFVKNYTLSNAPETFIGSDTRDIGPGATVEFSTTWVAPGSGHHCVVARIPLYQVPTAPGIVELTELNNVAQSNYDRFIPSTASPSTREFVTVDVTNPFDEEVTVYLNGAQTNDLYRVLVGNRWVRLKPHQSTNVQVCFEYAPVPGADELPDDLRHYNPDKIARARSIPNLVGLTAWARDPRVEADSFTLLGGAMAEVQTGRQTLIKLDRVDDHFVSGVVFSVDDGTPVTNGTVLLTLDPSGAKRAPEKYEYAEGKVRDDGSFGIEFRGERWKLGWVDYLPFNDYAPSTSEEFSR